jgi:hypothetical protein
MVVNLVPGGGVLAALIHFHLAFTGRRKGATVAGNALFYGQRPTST